jgi:glycosyltransferase involved in cell wall biosynthesis
MFISIGCFLTLANVGIRKNENSVEPRFIGRVFTNYPLVVYMQLCVQQSLSSHTMKKVVVSVINDLVTDQRVHRNCMTLHEMGYDVLLVGRLKRDSMTLAERPYQTHRMKLVFEKGFFFYFFFQIRLWFFLRKQKVDLYFANDLDTLWPNYRIAKAKKKELIYDTHEIFTEVPELVNRPFKQRIWKFIERSIFPKLKYTITVNESISEWYTSNYGVKPVVVRNIPRLGNSRKSLTRGGAHLPEDKKIILLQGAGINIHRGAEELVEAMKYISNAVLLIIGSGDVLPVLHELAEHEHLEGKIIFIKKLPPDELRAWTCLADLGLSLDKDTNINYRFSLPNKIFDYIHAGIPVLVSNLVELKRIVEQYQIGQVLKSHTPKEMAVQIQEILASSDYTKWKENTKLAATELNWEKEVEVLKKLVRSSQK